MEKKHIIIGVVVLVILAGAYWWFKMRKPATKSAYDGSEDDSYEDDEFKGKPRPKHKTKESSNGGIGEGMKNRHNLGDKNNYEDGEEFDGGEIQDNKSFGGNLK